MAKKKQSGDLNQRAKNIVDIATGQTEGEEEEQEGTKNKAAAELGRLGGKARAKKLSPEERSAIAKKAAKKRWEDKNED